MRLVEHEGKELLRKAGILTPVFQVLNSSQQKVSLTYPLFLKSQVPISNRKRKGAIREISSDAELQEVAADMLVTPVDGYTPEYLLAEEHAHPVKEYYVSFSYAGSSRGPVMALGKEGGTGVDSAAVTPVPILRGLTPEFAQEALVGAGFEATSALVDTLISLWNVFLSEKLALLEVNPLFVLSDGRIMAGDAKMVTDSAVTNDTERPYVSLGGDIAVIASGGGASMLTIDLLMRAGGKPANYVEYSGNPPASVVEDLTVRVLATPELRGAWIVGGTANFTDTYETMKGFLDGLRRTVPKPTYPIVVRRDGPRQKEAQALLEQVARDEHYDITVFGPECSMDESARILIARINAVSP